MLNRVRKSHNQSGLGFLNLAKWLWRTTSSNSSTWANVARRIYVERKKVYKLAGFKISPKLYGFLILYWFRSGRWEGSLILGGYQGSWHTFKCRLFVVDILSHIHGGSGLWRNRFSRVHNDASHLPSWDPSSTTTLKQQVDRYMEAWILNNGAMCCRFFKISWRCLAPLKFTFSLVSWLSQDYLLLTPWRGI